MSDDQENLDQDAMADEWAAALAEQDDTGGGDGQAEVAAQVSKPELDQFESATVPAGSDEANLDLILDIPVTIAMEIGRTRISIRNLLQLNQGSVVELDRLAGEPMDVLVNGTLVAHGEVVVVNEKFGIRLTDVVSPAERVKKLK
ncbi:flagellar motor switch protein FliN [Thiohalobacter sp. COW1]|uniref:Flagellar motor switch protein FliN n=1 Tax=Thiohalobacter thiocyanaticus TaxID=585455 RepID=A0A1Z4VQW9_9GAMM|nr:MULTISPECIES: flagellar motor switch protein FliN [Thiohalobacter]BAZ93883.1 surface presentation of antigens (SpoA) protein [Thiohalobacter thiocyanaticus]BCO31049.1 flagellar motor switch protein FliN [Thiohalobacter sp. COW1]